MVAEVLDHTIFFALADLGKALPAYEEIALPVELDADIYDEYDRTRALLKDYLVQRRWEGDSSFRGAYLQWSMGWLNATFRPMDVIHNIRHPITGDKKPHIVTRLPSYGEDRIYAKEQALIDLVKAELEAGRPCVVYLRQTATKDIQPRIEGLLRKHVPDAIPYILKNTVQAERREKVIEAERSKGMNVLICNPELVKTGLDLLFSPTLIFFEITFNLSTMMQAAARAYRLNQTHKHCKTYYIYAEGTMEHTAVQLMSRKQRAAKLLTGDIGLTGLDSLTEGEGGFEQALMDAIAKDEALLDPSEMFKVSAGHGEIDAEDMAYWNVEVAEDDPEIRVTQDEADPLVQTAVALGGIVVADDVSLQKRPTKSTNDTDKLVRYLNRYLDTVHLIQDQKKLTKLQAKLISILTQGVQNDDETYLVIGMRDPDFSKYPVHEERLLSYVKRWLKRHRVVFMGCEAETATTIVDLAKQAVGLTPLKLNIFEKLQDLHDETQQVELTIQSDKIKSLQKRETKQRKRKVIDLNAVPDILPNETNIPLEQGHRDEEELPQQLAMF